MPVVYEIDQARAIIRTRCVGDVSFNEVIGHFHRLESDPACPPRLDVLLDLSDLTSLPDPGQLREVSSQMGTMNERVRFGACVIVAPRTVLFGLLRMFEVFAEERFRTTRVFREIGEAEAWLLDHLTPTV
jgi:hypothetical protein